MAAFYLDHNVQYQIGIDLRNDGHSARMARDLHHTRIPDFEILTLASQNHWIIITHNRKDFVLLQGAWLQWSNLWGLPSVPDHSGILVLPDLMPLKRASVVITELLRFEPTLINRMFQWRRDQGWIDIDPTRIQTR